MTRKSDFKKLIRARMDKTGERYTTARAALLGELAAQTPPRAKHDQTFALLRLLEAHADWSDVPSEARVLGLGGGISFQFNVFDYEGLQPLAYIGTRCNPQYAYNSAFIERACQGLGAEFHVYETGSKTQAQQHLTEALKHGPAICWVGREALLGEPSLGGATPWVVVVHDIEDGTVGVEDCRAGALEVPVEQLAVARAAVKKQKHRVVAVTSRAAVDDDAATRQAVAHCVSDLDGEVVMGGSAKNFGLAALQKWAELADASSKRGWPTIFGPGRGALAAIRQSWAWLFAATDGTGFRAMYADFLRDAGRHDAAELVAANGDLWTALAEDLWRGEVPVLGAARAHLESTNPFSPHALEHLGAQADDELDNAFASSLYGRLAGQLRALAQSERDARDALTKFVR